MDKVYKDEVERHALFTALLLYLAEGKDHIDDTTSGSEPTLTFRKNLFGEWSKVVQQNLSKELAHC